MNSEFGVRNSEFGVLNLEFVVLNSEFCVRNSEFCVRNSEFGVLNSEFGVLNSEFGVRNSEFGVLILFHVDHYTKTRVRAQQCCAPTKNLDVLGFLSIDIKSEFPVLNWKFSTAKLCSGTFYLGKCVDAGCRRHRASFPQLKYPVQLPTLLIGRLIVLNVVELILFVGVPVQLVVELILFVGVPVQLVVELILFVGVL
ncbi:hypothetical protein NIES2100_55360 [Calothrix sp. NIES-2100]|nr:hypothetical protein NIES2100_55360 [Calothrix sp. NIES-2100]